MQDNYDYIDSIVRAWEALKREFEAERPITLEQQLFYKAVNLMEVRHADSFREELKQVILK